MKADITRETFDPANHFSRIFQQQGRVTLDADNNEQTAILLHYLRSLARDLIGPYGAPAQGGGFALATGDDGKLTITPGRFYIDGILVENDQPCLYTAQPDYRLPDDDPLQKEMQQRTGKAFWVYLDVWERHVTWLEHDGIREKALGGPDTCTRAKVVWQVKALATQSQATTDDNIAGKRAELEAARQVLEEELARTTAPSKVTAIKNKIKGVEEQIAKLDAAPGAPAFGAACAAPLAQLQGISTASLAARVDPGQQIEDPCITSPEARYRGVENQLYRVEIHRGGTAGTATFKWARDNGSIASAWLGTSGAELLVADTRGFAAGNWVELSHEELDLQGRAGRLVRLAKVDNGILTVDLESVPTEDALAWSELLLNPTLRRWDQVQVGDVVLRAGAVPVEEATETDAAWLDLEDGLQLRFAAGGNYRTGDYWLIPARVATGNIEWTSDAGGNPAYRPPLGVQHHYAPLGFVRWDDAGNLSFASCRCEFAPLGVCPAE